MSNAELDAAAEVLRNWAAQKPLIRRVLVFGSIARGDYYEASDLDVAVELDPGGADEDALTTYVWEHDSWKSELRPQLRRKLQLEWHDPNGTTPTVTKGLEAGSVEVYRRAT